MKTQRKQIAADPIAVRIPQAVAMLGIGRSKLYQCIGSGDIETIKVGRATLIPIESLHAFIAARREGASAGCDPRPVWRAAANQR